jgi:hypothetical protein
MSTCEYKILARELQNNASIADRDADLNPEQLSAVINEMMAQLPTFLTTCGISQRFRALAAIYRARPTWLNTPSCSASMLP